MPRLYQYVGPKAIADRLATAAAGTRIHCVDDLLQWARPLRGRAGTPQTVTATFVIDEAGILRVADRRSEHFACAGGERVLSAGEMTFEVAKNSIEVTWVTNQSTGYCPEPESWNSVSTALECAGIRAPFDFSQKLVFRHCELCGSINVVKDSIFVCDVCSADLPLDWNFRSGDGEIVADEAKRV